MYLSINSLVDQQRNSTVESKFVSPAAKQRMQEANIKDQTIQVIYSLRFNVTKDTRHAIFQYKIIHHILPTNSTLFYRDSINATCVETEDKR